MKAIGLAILGWLFAASIVQADPRDDALSAMLRCSGIGDKAQRLVCYDSAAVRVPGALNHPAPMALTTSSSAVPPPAPAIAPREQPGMLDGLLNFGQGAPRQPQTSVAAFGSESIASGGRQAHPNSMDGDAMDQISARLVRYTVRDGFMQLTLDNGQVWQQMVGPPTATLSRPALEYVAVISRGTGGYYRLQLSHYGRTLSVRRVQ